MKATKKGTITWFIPEGWKARIWRIVGRPAWHPEHSLASVWIRGYQIASYLQQWGYNTLYNRLKPTPHVAIFLRRYSEEDVALARSLKRQGVRIVVDVVVNYFSVCKGYDRHKVGFCSERMVRSFRQLVDLADQVWCASPFLGEVASQYRKDVRFVPESVDPEHFNPDVWNKRENSQLVFGWSGYAVKAKELSILKPWIISNHAQLLVISDRPPRLDFHYEFKRWRYGTFPRNISKCDLCVAPREVQDNYNRGHSFFKIGVFMAMGVPALAGPVPSYELLLGEGKGGAICRSLEDWKYYLEHFLSESELRSRWGLEARKAMEPYLTPNVVRQVDGLIKHF